MRLIGTCGQIFDSKCTILIPGKTFGQSGSVRVCKPCEAIIAGRDSDSSVVTDDDLSPLHGNRVLSDMIEAKDDGADTKGEDYTKIRTPTIGIPVSRRMDDSKRKSAVIAFENQIPLTRPTSSRSLKSASGRPKSANHKRHRSHHQHMKSLKSLDDMRPPFHRHIPEDSRKRVNLPAFHNDSIIDPELEPFLSDDGSSEEEHMSMFASLNGKLQGGSRGEASKDTISGSSSLAKRSKVKNPERSPFGSINHNPIIEEIDNGVQSLGSTPRKRSSSVSSTIQHKLSPKRSRSSNLLRGYGSNVPENQSPPKHLNVPGGSINMKRSSSMRGSSAPAVELNKASLQHVRRLLRQLLQDAESPFAKKWASALMPIILQCTDDVEPNVHHGDDIDIRHYLKLKKIPGGIPGDTSYVSGVVFTKNVALKSMPRSLAHPRIMIIKFAIEYARPEQHFLSLGPVIAQEREYLKNLVNRILAMQPNLLLVERGVSGIALELLEKAHVAVATNVKPSVLSAVARCTKTEMILSVEELTHDPSRMGTCSNFEVKTYIFGGRKKSCMYVSGCQRDLGCTIVLRGAAISILQKLKRITEFMCYVVYNLKLETSLMRDEFVLIPSIMDEESGQKKDGKLEELSGRVSTSQVYKHSIPGSSENSQKSSSTQGQKNLSAIHQSSENSTARLHIENLAEDEISIPTFYSDIVEKHKTKVLSSSPFVTFMQPYILMRAREQESRLAYLKRLRDRYLGSDSQSESSSTNQKFELVKPEMMDGLVTNPSRQVRDFLFAVHDARYDNALHNYHTQKRQWEAFISRSVDLFDPFTHQYIAVLYSLVNTKRSTPCSGPDVIAFSFYQEHDVDTEFDPDCTLGQYVEDLCYGAYTVCGLNGCNKSMLDHHRQYVHGEGQVSIFVQKYPSKIRGLEKTILMWSCCRICGQETQVTPMSANSWKYSLGKYLELSFWSSVLRPRANVCTHDIHRDHLRYFGLNNLAIRIQYDKIQLYEVVVPRPTVTWKVDSDLKLKNDQFMRMEDRINRFMHSVKARIQGIIVETVLPEKEDACKAEKESLMKRANEEHEEAISSLRESYMGSRYYEIVPFNRSIKTVQEYAINWDETFAIFERDYFPSEKDVRRLAALQLKKIFMERDETSPSLVLTDDSVNTPSIIGGETLIGTPIQESPITPIPSEMSAEKAHNVMSSVVEEHRGGGERLNSQESKTHDPPASPHSLRSDSDGSRTPLAENPNQRPDEGVDGQSDSTISIPRPNLSTANSDSSNSNDTSQDRANDVFPVQNGLEEPSTPSTTVASPGSLEIPGKNSSLPITDMTRDSRIPRPRLSSRKSDTTIKPALLRTQSYSGNRMSRRDTFMSIGSSSKNSISPSTQSSRQPELYKQLRNEYARVLERRISEKLVSLKSGRGSMHSLIPRSIQNKRLDNRVSALANHFEQLSREFERERFREMQERVAGGQQARANPLALSRPVVEVYGDANEAVQEQEHTDEEIETSPTSYPSGDSSILNESSTGTYETENNTAATSPVDLRTPSETAHESLRTESGTENSSQALHGADYDYNYMDQLTPDNTEATESLAGRTMTLPSESSFDITLELPKHEKTSLLKVLANFWSERTASGWKALDYPLGPLEHCWQDSDIVVREDEPSSLIALALSHNDYLTELGQTLQEKKRRFSARSAGGGAGGLLGDEYVMERTLVSEKASHMSCVVKHGTMKAQCKIFYAESFDSIRRKCGVSDRFVESLSRCLKWDSKGGKTKSLFLKTLDDRFVLKSLSRPEVDAFNPFAPNYFAFMSQTLFHGLPSVIAKMFGLFQVVIKNPATGVDFNWYMLVMENLFYDRGTTRRFDLKGSMRNRKVESTGEQDEVLLDENLVDIIYEKPIFVREHTSKLLQSSVWNDTLFLSKQNVMDYSLMAGFDESRSEIVVGIIDSIRTYTWDKKLESWIKDRGKNKPTITNPKDYRNRFRASISNYILLAPNCWYHLQPQLVTQPSGVALMSGANRSEIGAISANGKYGKTGSETEPEASLRVME